MNSPKERLRVWHLISNRWNSAITEYMISSVRSLEYLGIRNVVTPLINSPAEARLQTYGICTKSVLGFSPVSLMQFKRLSLEIRADILISYGGPETIISKFLAGTRISRFYRFRGQPVDENGYFNQALQNISHRHVCNIIVPSRVVLAQQSSECQNKSVVIPLGVDTERFKRTVSQIRGQRPELLIFGRLDPIKGHGRFLNIFRIMLEGWKTELPRPVLRIVGREENIKVADLEAQRTALGIDRADLIYVPERVEDPASIMTSATLGIIPSLGSELICRVAHEFLLCGTPIFVSGAGALDEVKLDMSTHSYLGLDDKQAAKKLLYLIQDSFLEEEVTRVQRAEAARTVYSIEAMSRHFQKLFGGP